MSWVEKAEQIRKRLGEVGPRTARVKMKCPHCKFRWTPKRGKEVQWCPKCHLDITEGKPKRETRVADIRILDGDRFTPGRMHKLCQLKLYKYMGVPRTFPDAASTGGRARKKNASVMLADKFFRSEMTGTEMAGELKITRQAFYLRLEKIFYLMLDRGCFQLTPKGKEKIAREKAEMAATVRRPHRDRDGLGNKEPL